MNYSNVYNKIIDARISIPAVGLIEKHHIVPRSLGGGNEKTNIVSLTPREHFICHHLLARIHGGPMWAAYFLMSNPKTNSARGVKVTSRQYQTARKNFVSHMSTMRGEKNGHYGMIHSDEAKKKISNIRKKYTLKKHPKAINSNLEWTNRNGETFSGSHFDLSDFANINHDALRRVAKGTLLSYKGWMCVSAKREDMRSGLNTNTADQKIYKWTSKQGDEYIGTRYFARQSLGLTQDGASRLVLGTTKTHKGWKVCHL